jgi:hypothetical protein
MLFQMTMNVAPASERVAKLPLPGDEKLINPSGQPWGVT